MVACDALVESNDFNNVMKHAKKSFRQNIENAKENLTETDVQFRKDQFEYFKHYATPLFNKAEKEHEIDLLITNIDYEDKFNELTKENKSLKEEIEKQNQKLKEQNQLLHGHCFIPVNGIKREIKNGLMNAFPEAVKRIHEANQKIQDLSQNKSINKKLNNSNGIEM